MKTTRRTFIHGAMAVAISVAEQADKKAGIAALGIIETKAIAEEGFI